MVIRQEVPGRSLLHSLSRKRNPTDVLQLDIADWIVAESLQPTVNSPTLDDLKDGQGFTLLFSENVQAAPWHRPGFLNALTERYGRRFGTGSRDGRHPETPSLVYSRFTNGLVWHYEDKKYVDLNALAPPPTSPSGTAVD